MQYNRAFTVTADELASILEVGFCLIEAVEIFDHVSHIKIASAAAI